MSFSVEFPFKIDISELRRYIALVGQLERGVEEFSRLCRMSTKQSPEDSAALCYGL